MNEASAELSSLKQQDLARDAGPDADAVRERLSDVAKFCLDVNGTNVFLVEGTRLQEDEWGREIQVFADLRLLHEIGNLSVQTGRYRGRRFVGFTLDLSNWTGARSERIKQLEFWTPEGRQEARRARLIYSPGASDQSPTTTATGVSAAPVVADEDLDGNWVQSNIFQLLGDPTASDDSTPVETLDTPASDSGRGGPSRHHPASTSE